MSTTHVLEIVCPDWCMVTPAKHAVEVAERGGECFHRSALALVMDNGRGPMVGTDEKAIPLKPIQIELLTATTPAGVEVASPAFLLNREETSLEQVVALRDAIDLMVQRYLTGTAL